MEKAEAFKQGVIMEMDCPDTVPPLTPIEIDGVLVHKFFGKMPINWQVIALHSSGHGYADNFTILFPKFNETFNKTFTIPLVYESGKWVVTMQVKRLSKVLVKKRVEVLIE